MYEKVVNTTPLAPGADSTRIFGTKARPFHNCKNFIPLLQNGQVDKNGENLNLFHGSSH